MDQQPWLHWFRKLTTSIPTPIFQGAGLVLIADSPALATKAALWGSSITRDALLLAPGLHKQKDLSLLSNGEYPACAAMTTGYVFRIENEAMVHYMQQVGRPGQLTTLSVAAASGRHGSYAATFAQVIYGMSSLATLLVISALFAVGDGVALGVILTFITVSVTNLLLIQRRAKLGWKGQKEPGIKSDLLVLLSQDRWIRLQGMTDDVKVVTSGQWLRQPTVTEDLILMLITIVVHLSAGAMLAATPEGKLLFLLLMVFSSIAIKVANASTDQLLLYGRVVKMSEDRKSYGRRLELAEELVRETGKDDWCEKMGIILTKDTNSGKGKGKGTGAAHM